MQCQHACELLSDYVSGDLDRALMVSLENHLAGCAGCREQVDGLKRAWGALDRIQEVDPPPFFHENIMARMHAERAAAEEASLRTRAMWDWRLLFRPRALAVAAAVLIVLLAGAHVRQPAVGARFFDPLGWVLALFHPAAAPPAVGLQSGQAEWLPDPRGGGTLVVHLKAAATEGRPANLACEVSLE
jgi:hypothetical protein